ncbi:MAG: ABC transporter substrate-binding protein [Armatimonadota bacterium]
MTDEAQHGMTRREFVVSGGVGLAGLAIGGLAGYGLSGKDSGTGGSSAGAAAGKPLNIAAAYPLTGPYAGDGAQMQMGLEMGIAEINAAGGVLGRQLKATFQDLEDLSTDKVVNAVQRALSGNPAALFMGYTTATSSEYPAIAQAGIPAFHNNTLQASADWVAKDLATRGSIFQTCPSEIPYGPGFANLVVSLEDSKKWTPSSKTAAIVTSLDVYSLNIANQFKQSIEKNGYKVTLFEKVNAPLSEWGPILTKIRRDPPGIIFFADYIVGDLASFTKQFRSSPTPSLLYEQYGPSVPEYLKLTGDAANGVIWSTVIGILPDAIGAKYKEDFQTRFNQKPGLSLAGAQRDNALIWWSAAARAGNPTDYAKVVSMVKAFQYRGVCGSYNFSPKDLTAISYPGSGDPTVYTDDPSLGLPNLTFQIQGQQQVLIFPDPYVQGSFQLPPWF